MYGPAAGDNDENAHSGNEEEENKQLVKKKDTNKIRTNIRYKCVDEESVGDDEGD